METKCLRSRMCVRFVLVLIVFLLTLTCCFSSRDTSSSDTNPTASGSGSESLSGGQSGSTKKPVDASKHTPSVRNETKHNENETATAPPTFYGKLYENKEMMMRAFYVLLAVTSIIVIYFGVKAWRYVSSCQEKLFLTVLVFKASSEVKKK